MSSPRKVLVVDDTPRNIRLLADLLVAKGYEVETAISGEEALTKVAQTRPDLVLLDVVMPHMSGYEVCERIRKDPQTKLLPVIMITALDPAEERVKGIEAGADDFLAKPINQPELFARVRSLLRVKELHEQVQAQAAQLREFNEKLEQRVQEQVAQIGRLERLKHFFAPQVAELVVAGGSDDPLKPHRRRITVVIVGLRGFAAFSESHEPEEVMEILREFHATMGGIVSEHEGTLDTFAGDGMTVIFNDPVEIDAPEERAVRMAVAIRESAAKLKSKWAKMGVHLGVGVGISAGYATIGAIGSEERSTYTAIGSVVNLAAQLCAAAESDQILLSERLRGAVEPLIDAEPVGNLDLGGVHQTIAYNVLGLKREAISQGSHQPPATSHQPPDIGDLNM